MAEGTATPTQEIEIKLENGMVIKGATPEEALQSAAKIIEDNVKSYRQTKEQLDSMQGKFQTVEQQLAEMQARQQPQNGNQFGKEDYFRTFAEDPFGANDRWFEQRFGAKPDVIAQQWGAMQNSISVMDGERLAANFLQNHSEDFPANPENAGKLRKEVEAMAQEGHPVSVDTMELAYRRLVDRGQITPLEPAEQQEELPPSGGGAGANFEMLPDADFEKLSTSDMEKYLKSQGRL